MYTSRSFYISTLLVIGLFFAVVFPSWGSTVSGAVTLKGRRLDPANVVVVAERQPPMAGALPRLKHATIDQKMHTFIPHVLPVEKGTQVRFLNSDDVFHHIYSSSPGNEFELKLAAPGEVRSWTFTHPGVLEVRCGIHSKMQGYILVLETPYFITLDAQGKFTLSGLPQDKYLITIWYEGRKVHSEEILVRGSEVNTINFTIEK